MLLEQIFFPRNKKFFQLFDELAVNLRKMSGLFFVAVTDDNCKLEQHTTEMESLEQLIKTLIRKLFVELGRNLITPFDREDIHFLATGLDSVSNYMLHTVRQLRNYRIGIDHEVTNTVAEQNHKAIELLALILNKLRDLKDLAGLTAICTDIKSILQHSDNLLDHSVYILLHHNENEFEVIKTMDHFDALQCLLQKIGDCVNAAETIIIKYA